MQQGAKSPAAWWLQIIQTPNKVFCFVEGRDEPYYHDRVMQLLKERPNFIKCGGKRCVIEAYRYIEQKGSLEDNERTLFFVDRDYDLYQVPKGIYITDSYSIENFYTSWETIERVLLDFMFVSEKNCRLAHALFCKFSTSYHALAVKLNAFCYTIRKYELDNNEITTIKFDNLKVGKYIEAKGDIAKCIFRSDHANYKQLCEEHNITYPIDISAFTENEAKFNPNNTYNFRGKFELQYITWFLQKIQSAIKNGKEGFDKKDIDRVHDFHINTLLIMSKFATTPSSLEDYIVSRLDCRYLSLNGPRPSSCPTMLSVI